MPWYTHGWHEDVAAEEVHETGDAAHARARTRAVVAKRQVGVFHAVKLKNGREKRTKTAVYDLHGDAFRGSASWRPLDERGDTPAVVDVGGVRVGNWSG